VEKPERRFRRPVFFAVTTPDAAAALTPILNWDGFTPERKAQLIEGAKTRIPLGRTGTAEEAARAVLYLAADTTYTTGAELCVDGGLIDL
jgi:NAD(P)-dependent dehydrogenase (short-subunit alcohol dehydrogenase family)